MRKLRVYLDTSVLGGCYDEEFAEPSLKLIEAAIEGRITALISDTLVAEVVDAPESVRVILKRVIDAGCERLALSIESQELRDAYISAGIVTATYGDDALHVAHASIARADVIVSWNFKHLVNPMRVRGFIAVNSAQGYGPLVIMTPSDLLEGLEADDEKEV